MNYIILYYIILYYIILYYIIFNQSMSSDSEIEQYEDDGEYEMESEHFD